MSEKSECSILTNRGERLCNVLTCIQYSFPDCIVIKIEEFPIMVSKSWCITKIDVRTSKYKCYFADAIGRYVLDLTQKKRVHTRSGTLLVKSTTWVLWHYSP